MFNVGVLTAFHHRDRMSANRIHYTQRKEYFRPIRAMRTSERLPLVVETWEVLDPICRVPYLWKRDA
jgi:hypothetical protein